MLGFSKVPVFLCHPVHRAGPLLCEPNAFEVEMTIDMVKGHKSSDIGPIPAELITATVGQFAPLRIHVISNYTRNKTKLLEEWKESIFVPINKKGDKTDCNNYRGISRLPATYKILSNILLSRLIPYAEEIIGDNQCGFRRNRSTTDHIFCFPQILEKKWE